MKNDKTQILKIGKISKEVESSFGVAFATDIAIYVRPPFLEDLIQRKSDSYLRAIEEISDIIAHPDIVYYSKSLHIFVYFRLYSSKSGFQIIGIKVTPQGRPKLWCVESMRRYGDQECVQMLKDGEFRRLAKAKKPKKAKPK